VATPFMATGGQVTTSMATPSMETWGGATTFETRKTNKVNLMWELTF
jgi:hypothetical protein